MLKIAITTSKKYTNIYNNQNIYRYDNSHNNNYENDSTLNNIHDRWN